MLDNFHSDQIRFCWFRESSPGHIERDDSLAVAKSDLLLALLGLHPAQQRTTAEPSVALDAVLAALSAATPLDTLPLWSRKRLTIMLGPLATDENRSLAGDRLQILARVAARALDALPPRVGVELHLPYIDRRSWAERFTILDKTSFVDIAGRVVPASLLAPSHMDEYNAQLLTVSAAHPGHGVGLTFAFTHQAAPGMLRCFLPVHLAELNLPAVDAEVRIRQTLSAEICRAWYSAPKETSGAYFTTHAPVSVAVQAALRRWLAWYWLSSIDHFADPPKIYTVLAYLVSTPFPGRRRTDFCHDTLGSEWIKSAFHHSRQPLRAALKQIRSTLVAAGREDLADSYHPREVKPILDRIRTERGTIRSLVAAEGDLVNHILKFGLAMQGVDDAIQVVHRVPEMVRGMGSRLRRLFNEQDLTWLGSMVLIEATNALWVAQGGTPAIHTTIQINPLPPGPLPC
jgi:hypothetical protein